MNRHHHLIPGILLTLAALTSCRSAQTTQTHTLTTTNDSIQCSHSTTTTLSQTVAQIAQADSIVITVAPTPDTPATRIIAYAPRRSSRAVATTTHAADTDIVAVAATDTRSDAVETKQTDIADPLRATLRELRRLINLLIPLAALILYLRHRRKSA